MSRSPESSSVTHEPRRTHGGYPTLDGGAFAIALPAVKEASVAHAKRASSERRAGAGSTFLGHLPQALVLTRARVSTRAWYAKGWGDVLPDPALLRDVAARSGGGEGGDSGEAPLHVSLFMVPGLLHEKAGVVSSHTHAWPCGC